jgi:hypothetical protein
MRIASLLLSVFLALTAGARSITLHIAVDPDRLLPRLTPYLQVWATNDSSSPAELPTKVALQVTSPSGQRFIAQYGTRSISDDGSSVPRYTMEFDTKPAVTLAPRESRDLTVWNGIDWLDTDDRFGNTIGTFRLQLVVDRGLNEEKLEGLTRVVDQQGLIEPLLSNEVTMTFEEPKGADLEVSKFLEDEQFPCDAAERIWRDYPTSRYAVYCPRDWNNREDRLKQIAGYQAALALDPPPILAERYRINLADAWTSRAWVLHTKDLEGTIDAYDRARELLQPLAKHSILAGHREKAAEMLENEVKERDEIVEAYERAHGRNDLPLRSYAVCFEDLSGGARKIWFSYQNRNSVPMEVPLGNDNKFTPPPFDRKQSTTFKPGMNDFAFNIVTREPSLVWHLQGNTAHFKLPETRECPKGFDPNDRETWQTADQ